MGKGWFWGAVVLVAVLAVSAVHSQELTRTRIQDVVFRADGSRLNGEATISWRSFTAANGIPVAQDKITVAVVDGVLSVELAPNEGAQPPGTSYEVVYNLDGSERFYETWVVPASPTPVSLSQIRVVGAPPSGAVISQSQVTGLVAELAARATLSGGNSLAGTQSIRETAAGEPVLALKTASGDRGVYFRLPALSVDATFTLPASDGSANQQLTTDGAGNLFWAPAGTGGGGGGGGGAATLSDLTDVSLTSPAAGQSFIFNGASWTNRGLAAADVQSGAFADERISPSSILQHQALLAIDWSQILGAPSALTPTAHAATHEFGGPDALSLDAAQVATGAFADARISRSSVDQHATATPSASSIPLSGAAGLLSSGWLGSGVPDATTFLRGDGVWAAPPGSGGPTALNDLTDVTISAPQQFHALKFNGASWVNGSFDGADIASGTINGGRLPQPQATVLGGVLRTTCAAGEFGRAILATGALDCAGPAAAAVTSVFGRVGAVVAAEGDYSLKQLNDVGAFTAGTDNVLRWTGTEWTAAAISGAMLPLPGPSALGGVTAQACSSGDFVTGISPSTGNPICATPAGGGSGGSGEPNSAANFTNQSSVVVPHNFGHNRLIVTCYDASENWMDWGGMSIGAGPAYDVTVTFAAAKTGRCVVNGSATQAQRHVTQFTSATQVVVSAATHGLGASPVVAGCRDASTPAAMFEPGAYSVGSNGDVVIDFAIEKTGECVIQ